MLKLKYSILKSKITEANLTIPKCPQCLNQRVYGLKKPNNIQNITTLPLEVDFFSYSFYWKTHIHEDKRAYLVSSLQSLVYNRSFAFLTHSSALLS